MDRGSGNEGAIVSGDSVSYDAFASGDLDLPGGVRELRQSHNVAVSYVRLWQAVVEGRVPATRLGGRWRVKRADLPGIAEVLARPSRPRAA